MQADPKNQILDHTGDENEKEFFGYFEFGSDG
jgi:hypothetical protein